MFVAQSVRTPDSRQAGARPAAADAPPRTPRFAERADRDFQQFVARYGSFKRYLPYPL